MNLIRIFTITSLFTKLVAGGARTISHNMGALLMSQIGGSLINQGSHYKVSHLNITSSIEEFEILRAREATIKSEGQTQRFLSALGIITSHFRPGRYLCTTSVYREMMKRRFDAWEQVAGAKEAA